MVSVISKNENISINFKLGFRRFHLYAMHTTFLLIVLRWEPVHVSLQTCNIDEGLCQWCKQDCFSCCHVSLRRENECFQLLSRQVAPVVLISTAECSPSMSVGLAMGWYWLSMCRLLWPQVSTNAHTAALCQGHDWWNPVLAVSIFIGLSSLQGPCCFLDVFEK